MSTDFLKQEEVAANDHLVADFQAYSAWRGSLTQSIAQLSRWLSEQDLNDSQTTLRIQGLVDRLKEDKLNIAFVAEFSRGKSELINAIFFAHYGKRILPSSAGRTTMCPTELLHDGSRAPCLQLLPIETRGDNVTTVEYRNYHDEWHNIPLNIDDADSMQEAFTEIGRTLRVNAETAKKFGL
ncbi:MAG: dynamin family protein, partial [Deefgea sp.]